MKLNEQARVLIERRAQIVKEAAKTPQGRALIDLIQEQFGDPQIRDNALKSYSELGAFQVVLWLQRMELFKRGEDL